MICRVKKTLIRTKDIPKIIYKNVSEKFGAGEEFEEIFAEEKGEIRVFRALSPERAGFDGMICLETFPAKEGLDIRAIFYLWISKNSFEYVPYESDFYTLSNTADIKVVGLPVERGFRETDSVKLVLGDNGLEMNQSAVNMLMRIGMIIKRAVSDKRFKKEKA